MIAIIAGSQLAAYRWAEAQNLDRSEWFYVSCEEDLLAKTNFHVVIGPEAYILPSSYFERLFNMAKERGMRDRKW